MVEYLVIAMTVIATLVALGRSLTDCTIPGGPISQMACNLVGKVDYQLRHASGTADFLFR